MLSAGAAPNIFKIVFLQLFCVFYGNLPTKTTSRLRKIKVSLKFGVAARSSLYLSRAYPGTYSTVASAYLLVLRLSAYRRPTQVPAS